MSSAVTTSTARHQHSSSGNRSDTNNNPFDDNDDDNQSRLTLSPASEAGATTSRAYSEPVVPPKDSSSLSQNRQDSFAAYADRFTRLDRQRQRVTQPDTGAIRGHAYMSPTTRDLAQRLHDRKQKRHDGAALERHMECIGSHGASRNWSTPGYFEATELAAAAVANEAMASVDRQQQTTVPQPVASRQSSSPPAPKQCVLHDNLTRQLSPNSNSDLEESDEQQQRNVVSRNDTSNTSHAPHSTTTNSLDDDSVEPERLTTAPQVQQHPHRARSPNSYNDDDDESPPTWQQQHNDMVLRKTSCGGVNTSSTSPFEGDASKGNSNTRRRRVPPPLSSRGTHSQNDMDATHKRNNLLDDDEEQIKRTTTNDEIPTTRTSGSCKSWGRPTSSSCVKPKNASHATPMPNCSGGCRLSLTERVMRASTGETGATDTCMRGAPLTTSTDTTAATAFHQRGDSARLSLTERVMRASTGEKRAAGTGMRGALPTTSTDATAATALHQRGDNARSKQRQLASFPVENGTAALIRRPQPRPEERSQVCVPNRNNYSSKPANTLPLRLALGHEESVGGVCAYAVAPAQQVRRHLPLKEAAAAVPSSPSQSQATLNSRYGFETLSPARVVDLRNKHWDNHEDLQTKVKANPLNNPRRRYEDYDTLHLNNRKSLSRFVSPKNSSPSRDENVAVATPAALQQAAVSERGSRNITPSKDAEKKLFRSRYYEAAEAAQRLALSQHSGSTAGQRTTTPRFILAAPESAYATSGRSTRVSTLRKSIDMEQQRHMAFEREQAIPRARDAPVLQHEQEYLDARGPVPTTPVSPKRQEAKAAATTAAVAATLMTTQALLALNDENAELVATLAAIDRSDLDKALAQIDAILRMEAEPTQGKVDAKPAAATSNSANEFGDGYEGFSMDETSVSSITNSTLYGGKTDVLTSLGMPVRRRRQRPSALPAYANTGHLHLIKAPAAAAAQSTEAPEKKCTSHESERPPPPWTKSSKSCQSSANTLLDGKNEEGALVPVQQVVSPCKESINDIDWGLVANHSYSPCGGIPPMDPAMVKVVDYHLSPTSDEAGPTMALADSAASMPAMAMPSIPSTATSDTTTSNKRRARPWNASICRGNGAVDMRDTSMEDALGVEAEFNSVAGTPERSIASPKHR